MAPTLTVSAGVVYLCVTIAGLLLASGACVSPPFSEAARRQVAFYDEALRLSIERSEVLEAGREIELSLRLTNRSTKTVDACIGPSRSVSFGSASSMTLVNHPGCMKPFTLQPSGELSWRETVKLAEAPAAAARLEVEVQIVAPDYCSSVGCAQTMLRATKGHE